jgi:AcrR family transcriptional regulator
MDDVVKPPTGEPGRAKRRYNSVRRREQARETRRRILDAANHLFVARGYAGTTIDVIASEAGVAVETVYAAFGSKRSLLAELVRMLVGGDDTTVTLLERPDPQAVRREPDQRRQIHLFADSIARILGRVAPMHAVMRCASTTEPEIAAMLREMHGRRIANLTQFVEWVAGNGPLRHGVDIAVAAETVWTLASGEVYLLLTRERGWSPKRYTRWLAESLVTLLLPEPPDGAASDEQLD